MRATRLVTLDLLFCHVGQDTISIFILFSDLSSVAAPGMVLFHIRLLLNQPPLALFSKPTQDAVDLPKMV
jgi:hypothetical protein